DSWLMMALIFPAATLLDRLRAAFPECYSDVHVGGPVPLSALRRRARELVEPDCAPEDHLSEACQEFQIPCLPFRFGDEADSYFRDAPFSKHRFTYGDVGKIFEVDGKKLVVVDTEPGAFHAAPVEC